MINKTIESIHAIFAEYDSEVLEGVWQSLFERCNQVLRARDGSDFEVEHTGLPNDGRRGESWRQR